MALTKAKLIADGVILQSNLHASHGITTADIGEGSNLYYTDARARAAVSVSGNALSYNSSTGVITSNFEESPTFTGNVVIDGTLDVNGSEILIGTNNTRLAENNLRFKAASDAYIDQNTVSQAIRFRTSSSSSLDTTPIIIAAGGVTTFSTDVHVGGATAARFKSDGTNTIVDAIPNPSSILFRNSGAVEKMRLDSSGNLGIGTTSPNHKLDIYSNENVPLRIHRPSNANLNISGAWGIGFSTRGDAINSTTDTRAGIFSYYNGNLFFATNTSSVVADPDASARMTITSAGDVGIGTTSPLGILQLNVDSDHSIMRITAGNSSIAGIDFGKTSDIDDARIRYYNSSRHMEFFVANGERMRIDQSGNVGIGTTSPSEKLDVAGSVRIGNMKLQNANGGRIGFNRNTANGAIYSSSYSAFQINGASSGIDYLSFEAYNSSGTFQSQMVYTSSGNLGIGTASPSALLDIAQGSASPVALEINTENTFCDVLMNSYYSTSATRLRVGTNDFQIHTNGGQNLTVTSGGNVGIGATSPGTKLDVAGSGKFQPGIADGDALVTIAQTNSNAYVHAGLKINAGNTNPFYIYQSGSSNTLRFNYNSLSDAGGQMVITSDGNVGIGTASPGEKLVVAGNIKANDVNGIFYTNGYTFENADTYVNTVTVSGPCLYEYMIAVNPNSAGSGSYRDHYYGKFGIGVGWNGSNVTQYIFQNAEETAPRSLYTSGGGNISITIRMIYSGGVYTELPSGTTCTVRFQGFSTSNFGTIILRRLI